MPEKKKIPIGRSDFKSLIEDNCYYVDKTLMIKDMIDSGSAIFLFPRPRRFGKTLNTSMLQYFFEAYDSTKTDNSVLFKDLNIWKDARYQAYQGRYPVILLTFKDIKVNNWDMCYGKTISLIASEFERHSYLLSSPRLSKKDKHTYQQIIDEEASQQTYEESLKFLSKLLSAHYNEKTLIIVDEYDIPIQSGYNNNFYNEIISFTRNFFSAAFKDNAYLYKGVITGILRVAKESIFSVLNNLKVCTSLSDEFSQYFGLLEDEVANLLSYYGLEKNYSNVKDWYNGYVFGNNIVYNPWSVLNYADSPNEGFKSYWVNTSSNEMLRRLVATGDKQLKNDFLTIINGDTITKLIDENIVYNEISQNPNSIWSFFLLSGYLKALNKKPVGSRYECELAVPNRELSFVYKDIIIEWFNETSTSDKVQELAKSILASDMPAFRSIFRRIVDASFSYFDISGKEPEKFYHGFVLGLMVNLENSYVVDSNRESGYGRYDVMLIPKNPTKHSGYVFEFKQVETEDDETLDGVLTSAMKQINDKNYAQTLINHGVQNIIKVAIAFESKKMKMIWE